MLNVFPVRWMGRKEVLSGGEGELCEKVKTVHQKIRQRSTIHHVPSLSGEGRVQIETSKIINTGEQCHQGLSMLKRK